MTAIALVKDRRGWDSCRQPTVEVGVFLVDGVLGRAIAPARASRATRGSIDLRDGGAALRGRGVSRALAYVDGTIASARANRDEQDQAGAAGSTPTGSPRSRIPWVRKMWRACSSSRAALATDADHRRRLPRHEH